MCVFNRGAAFILLIVLCGNTAPCFAGYESGVIDRPVRSARCSRVLPYAGGLGYNLLFSSRRSKSFGK